MKINLSETFPHLPRAPIVEAVIDLRAKPSVQWDQEDFQRRLREKLPDYPITHPQRQIQGKIEINAEAGKIPEQSVTDLGWTGLIFRTPDQRNVAKFEKDGFAFSRLEPYQEWKGFETEALRLWKVYAEIAMPVGIQRIGVRFINQMSLTATELRFEDFLAGMSEPLPSWELPVCGFFHQDTLLVPDTQYVVNLIRTLQPVEGTPTSIPVILDVDVFTNAPMEMDEALLKQRLAEMRFLKNKVFFAAITERTKGMFT